MADPVTKTRLGSLNPREGLVVTDVDLSGIVGGDPVQEIARFAATGTVFRASSYGTQTRWADATGCVWEVTADKAPWTGGPSSPIVWDEETGGWLSENGLDLLTWSDGEWSFGCGTWTVSFSCMGEWGAMRLVLHSEGPEPDVILERGLLTNLVGRVALTNDIPTVTEPDFTTNNTQLVATIEATVPDVPSASDATPLMDGTASAGTTNEWARGDHVHPSDTAKLDGAAVYPSWNEVTLYGTVGTVVSHKGRLWRNTEPVTQIEPGASGVTEWTQVYLKDLKQDALPYPTNAIPYAAITGSPTPPSVFYDAAGGAASVSGATLTYQAASNSVGHVALGAGTNVLHITAPTAIAGHVRDFGLTVTTEDAATITLDASVSWRFDSASTNLSAGSWNRVYCTESPIGVFSLQLWTPDSAQEATP